MNTVQKVAVGAAALALGTALIATRPVPATRDSVGKVARAQLATVSPAARHDVDYRLLDQRLERLMSKPAMVGLSVGVVENGRITFLKGYGETIEGSGQPVTPETVFRWASLSKGVAATMVTELAEAGKVNMRDPIAAYRTTLRLPGGAEQRATVADLLSHRLGIYHNAYDEKLEDGVDPRAIRAEIGSLSLVCQPGTCWNYENVAFDAASEIVERETGMPYEEALRQRLFDPLGMTSASASMAGLTSARSWARPHGSGRRELKLSDSYYRVPAAGGVNSDIKDLALWMMAQMGEMPDVISPRVLGALHAPLVKTPGELRRLHAPLERFKGAWYGYGWRSYDYAGHRIVGHRGGVDGYRSLIIFDPARKSGVVALWNSNTNLPGALEFEVMDMIYHLPFRDWLRIDSPGGPTAVATGEDEASDNGSK